MKEIIEINLVKLAKNELNINEYLTIHKIAKNITGDEFPFSSEQRHLDSLEVKGWIVQSDEDILLTRKSENLIQLNNSKTTSDNFDEFFNLYPYRTPNGRILRSRNKNVGNTITRNYITARDKYLKKVNNIELHKNVMKAVELMKKNAKTRGGEEYIQQLETFINQNAWEKYMEEDENPIISSEDKTLRI